MKISQEEIKIAYCLRLEVKKMYGSVEEGELSDYLNVCSRIKWIRIRMM